MTAAKSSTRSVQRTPFLWVRGVAVAILILVGTCEALVTNRAIGWDWAPGWLSGTVVIVGYLAYLILFGLTSLVGNLAVAALVIILIWRRWGQPFWQAAAVAAPYLVAFYQGFPKSW